MAGLACATPGERFPQADFQDGSSGSYGSLNPAPPRQESRAASDTPERV